MTLWPKHACCDETCQRDLVAIHLFVGGSLSLGRSG
jgi:hypothetical protein